MGFFEIVKEEVSVRAAADRYGVHVKRGRMARCPFHNDHIPSLMVKEDQYHCFGCGAHGDVIDSTARLFSLRPYDAARKLAVDFGIDPNFPPACVLKKPMVPITGQGMISSLRAYVKKLENWKTAYAPHAPDDALDLRFIEACRNLDTAKDHLDSLQGNDSARREQVMDLLRAECRMDVERKGIQSYQSQLYVRFLCFGNGALTALYDRSNGFYRRQIALTTKGRPPDRVDDPFLSENLIAEKEGIFLWMLEGLRRLIAHNYHLTVSQRAQENISN